MLTLILTAFVMTTAPVAVQDPPAPTPDWHPFSRSTTTVYLAEVAGMSEVDGITRVHVARAPLTGSDFSHEVDIYALRCARREIRFLATDTYDGSGELTDRYEETLEEWDPAIEGTNYGFLLEVACNGKRSAQGSYPSVTAFIGQNR